MNPEIKQKLIIILTALAIGGVGFFAFVLLLQPVFSGQIVLPQNINLGVLHIQFYGIILGIAALMGYWLSIKRLKQYTISRDDADNIFLIVLISGFVGARLYHVFSEASFYLAAPIKIFEVWNGGLSIFGAGIGGVLGLFLFQKFAKKYSFLNLLDWLTPSVVLGQIIGRFGNFVNYELYGTPTNLPWKMFVPRFFRLPPYELNQYFHPLFLYEAAGSVAILYILLRFKMRPGVLFLTWLFLYNVMRFFLENLRVGSVFSHGIRVNAIVAIGLALIALIIYVIPRPSNN